MNFRPIHLDDRLPIQRITFASGLRNCNFTFANLFGWRSFFGTEVTFADHALAFRFHFDNKTAYMIAFAALDYPLCRPYLKAFVDDLIDDATLFGNSLVIMGLEDDLASSLSELYHDRISVEPQRNRSDYIYLRSELALLQGKNLKNKRNHVNKFRSLYPNSEYRPLSPDLFDQCRQLEKLWRSETFDSLADNNDTADMEQQVMENIFAHWDQLDMQGGAIFVDNQLVAFTYGAPVSPDTFDVCVEKADRYIEGAFSVINQQFAAHLPDSFRFLNREEDMGLPGLRKAKLSYHPELLLPFNTVSISIPNINSADPTLPVESLSLLRCSSHDVSLSVRSIAQQYGFPESEVNSWFDSFSFNWQLSVKALTPSGHVVGLLNMCNYRISDEAETIPENKRLLVDRLENLRSVAVFSFIVSQQYRHTKLNFRMLNEIREELHSNFDYIFIPVMLHLKTHAYWQRWGAVEIFRDRCSVYYILPLSDVVKQLIS